jgi:hypothetical protein
MSTHHPILSPQNDPRIEPEQILALQVIRRALDDARGRNPRVTPAERADAVRFLADEDGSLSFWLQIAGFPPRVRAGVCERIARALERERPGARTGENTLILLDEMRLRRGKIGAGPMP